MEELRICLEKSKRRSARNKRYRDKCHRDGKCTRCAIPLFDEEDKYKTCVNCRDRVGKGFSWYGIIDG